MAVGIYHAEECFLPGKQTAVRDEATNGLAEERTHLASEGCIFFRQAKATVNGLAHQHGCRPMEESQKRILDETVENKDVDKDSLTMLLIEVALEE